MACVVIYTTTYCPYCRLAKSLLKNKQIPFTEVNVERNDKKRAWLVNATGQKTVPQIFINDKPVGGYVELKDLESTGELDKLLLSQ